jgi:hypothetical protein
LTTVTDQLCPPFEEAVDSLERFRVGSFVANLATLATAERG